MFVPFTLFHVDRHLKKLDNHSQYSVEQIGSDCTRIDLRASVFQKFSGGGGGGGGQKFSGGLRPRICTLRKTSSRPAPLIKNIFLRLCSVECHHTVYGQCMQQYMDTSSKKQRICRKAIRPAACS